MPNTGLPLEVVIGGIAAGFGAITTALIYLYKRLEKHDERIRKERDDCLDRLYKDIQQGTDDTQA